LYNIQNHVLFLLVPSTTHILTVFICSKSLFNIPGTNLNKDIMKALQR